MKSLFLSQSKFWRRLKINSNSCPFSSFTPGNHFFVIKESYRRKNNAFEWMEQTFYQFETNFIYFSDFSEKNMASKNNKVHQDSFIWCDICFPWSITKCSLWENSFYNYWTLNQMAPYLFHVCQNSMEPHTKKMCLAIMGGHKNNFVKTFKIHTFYT